MAETARTARVTYMMLFVGLVGVVVFFKLLPIQSGPGRIPGPDVLVLLTFAWVLRRPDYVPVWLIAALFLVADLLLMRPPGLWAALVVLGAEFLRARIHLLRDGTFLAEWAAVAGVIAGMFLANAMMLTVVVVDQPALGLTLIRLLTTIACYPIVVAVAARAFGLTRQKAIEADLSGRRR